MSVTIQLFSVVYSIYVCDNCLKEHIGLGTVNKHLVILFLFRYCLKTIPFAFLSFLMRVKNRGYFLIIIPTIVNILLITKFGCNMYFIVTGVR